MWPYSNKYCVIIQGYMQRAPLPQAVQFCLGNSQADCCYHAPMSPFPGHPCSPIPPPTTDKPWQSSPHFLFKFLVGNDVKVQKKIILSSPVNWGLHCHQLVSLFPIPKIVLSLGKIKNQYTHTHAHICWASILIFVAALNPKGSLGVGGNQSNCGLSWPPVSGSGGDGVCRGVEFRTAGALQLGWGSERCPLTAGVGSCQSMNRAAQMAAKLWKRNTSGFLNTHSFCFLFLAPT